MRKKILILSTIKFGLIPLGLATSILTARLLLPEGRGELSIFQATLGLIVLVGTLGIPSGTTYFLCRRLVSLKRYTYIFIFSSSAFFTLVVSLLFLLVQLEYVDLNNKHDFNISLLGILFFIIMALSKYISTILVSLEKQVNISAFGFVNGAIILLTLVSLITFSDNRGLDATVNFLSLKLIIDTVGVIMLCIYCLRTISSGHNPHGIHWRETPQENASFNTIFKYSISSSAAEIIQSVSYRIDIYLVAFYLGLAGAGIYTLGVGLLQYLWLIPTVIVSAFLPSLSSARASIHELAGWASTVFWCSCVAAVVLCAIAPILIPFLYGDAFTNTIYPIFALAPGIVLFTLSKIFAGYVAANGKAFQNTIASSLGLVIGLCAHVALIPRFGLVGAGIGTSLGYIATTAYVIYVTKRTSGLRYSEIVRFSSPRRSWSVLKGFYR